MEETNKDKEKKSITKSVKSSKKSSILIYEKLDPDLPNFTSTKRLPLPWKIHYLISFMIFSLCFFITPLYNNILTESTSILPYLVGSMCYVICTCMKWWHYHRGCCSYSNLNSSTKTNIDNSCIAILNRAKVGFLYFCAFSMAILLLFIFTLEFMMKSIETNIDNKLFDSIFMGAMIVLTIVQVLKFEKIATPTKQYIMINDISNFFVEWFLLSGFFIYSLGLIGNVINSDSNVFLEGSNTHVFFCIGGGILFVLSGIALFFRFCCSDDSDLNIMDESDYSE